MKSGDKVTPGERPRPRCLHVFPSFGNGGVPIRITGVINSLGGQYQHIILALDGDREAASRLDTALEIPVIDAGIDKSRPIAALLRIRRLLREISPDLLMTYNWGAIEWALVNRFFTRCPHIHFESGFGPEEADGQLPRRVRARRLALAKSDRVIVPSRTLEKIAIGQWKLGRSSLVRIPNGVDCALFAPRTHTRRPAAFPASPEAKIIGTVAPLRPEKNIFRLIDAFAAMDAANNTFLVIAGDGSVRAALEEHASLSGAGDRIIFTGHVDHPEDYYPCFDVFALSSDTEQMPNSLLQAMASGCPVAAVDVGDVRDMVAEENRPFIVPRDDREAFSRAMTRLITSPDLARDIGSANRQHAVAAHSIEKMHATYQDMIDTVLSKKASVE